ncbi:hypothetical protein [Streptomyces lydicus]|uniref:hypothetical protein n=1 Tax=Streptomyces lydicus TaxID=47763 RepID=UPI001010B7C3|nr:hypothetical protein [Streptomyces lydicus]MCZ1012079.1 hypothetical protein [Streptomyces lydicus]
MRDPREFIAAVEDLAETHPHSTGTTLRVARDIATRMPNSKDGHVAYGLLGMMKRLRLARSTVTTHIRVLRELGLLAWVSHGSSHNVLRTRLGDSFTAGTGYRGTATIYAPCAPPAWDRIKGRIRDGHGYLSRVRAYTPHGREQAIADARHRRTAHEARRTPSFTSLPPSPPAPIRGETNTRRTCPAKPRTPASQSRQPRQKATRYSPQETKASIAYAQRLRLEVWWAQASCERRLAYALRPLIEAGYTADQAARELCSWGVTHRPENAAGYIRAELRRRVHAGLLLLPEASVGARIQAPADEESHRYAAMLARGDAQRAQVYARYREHLAGPLRTALRKLRDVCPAQSLSRWRPVLREPEQEFYASLPSHGTPLEVYGARAAGRAAAYRPTEPPTERALDEEELTHHLQAAAAFERLRAQLGVPAAAAAAGGVIHM